MNTKTDFFELVGIVLGDGNLWNDKNHFRVEITSDPLKDNDYLRNHVAPLTQKFTKTRVTVKERSFGLRVRVTSKDFFNKFINIGMYPRDKKLEKLKFLDKIEIKNRKFILKGLMDTDGCVILRSNKQTFLEIATCSKFLSIWINDSLKLLGFRSFITKYTNRKNQTIYRIWLSGKENIKKWVALIGFSNKYKFDKAVEILNEGL